MKKIIILLIGISFGYNSYSQKNSHNQLAKNINQVFESFAHYNRFNGSVLISQNQKIIYQKSFGYANMESLKKNTKNSIFSIASVTKPLTAVGIMKLVDEGKLSLDTPISTFFPNFISDFSKKITVRHLLNHSSGMQANIGRKDNQGNGIKPKKNPITLDELLKKFKDSKLKFEPGKGYEYNNFGYTLLAYIIERVTKMPYSDYMEKTVFKPANMKNTAANNYKKLKNRALPYQGLGFKTYTKLTSSLHTSWIKGAGNINSTVLDLYNFMKALESGNILKPTTVDKLYSLTQSRGVDNSKYGLGWRIQIKGGQEWINHTGLLPGAASIIGFLPQKNIKIIILSNTTTTDLFSENNFQGKEQFVDGEIIDAVIAVLQGEKVALLPKPRKSQHKKIADYNKTFHFDNKHAVVLKKHGATFTLETLGKEPWSVFTYKFSRDAKKNNKASETALIFAKAMSTQHFTELTKYATSDMKGFLGSEKGQNQLKGMWAYFLKNAGAFKSYNIYQTQEKEGNTSVKIRFHFEKEDVGFVIAMNTENLIQGMFMDDNIRTSTMNKVSLTQINDHEFFINGHQHNGMQDVRVKIAKDKLTLIDGQMKFNAQIK